MLVLKVTLHSGLLKDVCLYNMLGKLEFGYTKLAAVASYKAELLTCGIGAHGITHYEDYPRWSASIWDLVMRLICRALYTTDTLPDMTTKKRTGAYAVAMCAVIEHWEDGELTRRAQIGTAQVTMLRTRGTYVCELSDDLIGTRTSDVFRHVPPVLTYWDLMCRAVAVTDYGLQAIPPKPGLMLPARFEEGGKKFVALGTLRRPARDGIVRWLSRMKIEPRPVEGRHGGVVPEAVYLQFLQEAM